MSVLPRSLLDALEADPSLWPGALTDDDRGRLAALFAGLPDDVRDVLVGSVVDPERNDWSRAATHGLLLAVEAGARVVGLATDGLLELTDTRGERFRLGPSRVR